MSSIDAFFKACIEGDLKTVNLQISLGVKVNAVNRDGLTGLILAYKNSHSDIGSAILAAGGDAAYQGKASGDTALIWCCHNSLQGAALELIEKYHAPPDTPDNLGFTPLMLACSKRLSGLVGVLLEKGVRVNHSNKNGERALGIAATKDLRCTELLVGRSSAIDLNYVDRNGHTPLWLSINSACNDIAIYLIRSGATWTYDNAVNGAFAQACERGGMDDVVRCFLSHKYDLHQVIDNDGNTLLHAACQSSRWAMARSLICHGADINTANKKGNKPLKLIGSQHRAIKEELEVTFQQAEKTRDWWRSARTGELDKCRRFLTEGGFDVNCQDALGNTALHYACHGCQARVVEYLLYERKALQLPNSDGRSPLHVTMSREKDAKIGDYAPIVKALLQTGFALQRNAAALAAHDEKKALDSPPPPYPGEDNNNDGKRSSITPSSSSSRFAIIGASILSSSSPPSSSSSFANNGRPSGIGPIPLGAVCPRADDVAAARRGGFTNVTLWDSRGESPLSYLATIVASLPAKDLGRRSTTATLPTSSTPSSSSSSSGCPPPPSSFSSSSTPTSSSSSRRDRPISLDGEGIGIEDAGEKLLSWQLGRLLTTGYCSDITFILDDGTSIKAHKAILGTRSPMFEGMFRPGSFSESTASEVPITHTPAPVFRQLIHYVYTGNVGTQDTALLVGILKAADEYSLPGLKLASEYRLLSRVEQANLAELLGGTAYNPRSLLRCACFEFIIRRYRQLLTVPGFDEFPLTQTFVWAYESYAVTSLGLEWSSLDKASDPPGVSISSSPALSSSLNSPSTRLRTSIDTPVHHKRMNLDDVLPLG